MKKIIFFVGFILSALFAFSASEGGEKKTPFDDSQRQFVKSDLFLHSENNFKFSANSQNRQKNRKRTR